MKVLAQSKNQTSNFNKGDKVVIVPNIPSRLRTGDFAETDLLDNYDENAVFMGSGYDGICQNRMVVPGENIVKFLIIWMKTSHY